MSRTNDRTIPACLRGAVALLLATAVPLCRAAGSTADRPAPAREGSSNAVLAAWIALDVVLLGGLVVAGRRGARAREKALRALEVERTRNESIVETVREPLLILGSDLRIDSANRAFYQTFGLTPGTTVGLPLGDLAGGQWARPGLLGKLADVATGVSFDDLEASLEAAGAPPRTLLLSARRLPPGGDGSVGILLAIHDLTPFRANEERIRELNREIESRERLVEEANREMEAFSHAVAHDLRAPLRHIDGFTHLLQKQLGSGLDETAARFLETIASSAKRLGLQIEELLAFSRVGHAEMRLTRTDMRELVAEVLHDMHGETRGRHLDWRIGELPIVPCDPPMIRQVWTRLLGNSVKYTRQKAVARIEVSHHTAGTEHVFSVRDNGAGFDMRHAAKLFGVFQRLHGDSEFEGIGIGLANVRRIVQRHGGRAWAEGRVGEGAVFFFSLPASPRPDTPAPSPS